MDLLKILDTAPEPAIVDAETMGVSGDTSGDYWLPAPMCLYQKELTDQIVSLHYSDILKYFETSDYKEEIVIDSMKTMCLNSEYIATHPYLLIDHFMPKSLITKDIPGNLAETSGKFNVLKDLITLLQNYESHVIIMARPGRTMDLLEALLLGNKVNIVRYDGQTIKSKNKPKNFSCSCHLLPSDVSDQKNITFPKDLKVEIIICFDPTCDPSKQGIQKIRSQNRPKRGTGNSAPAIRLTTINSIDHCELYFGNTFEKGSREYLVNVAAAVVLLRDTVGTLPPDLRPIYSQHLNYLSDWLNDPTEPWPLPDIYPINIYTSMDVEKSLLTEVNYNQGNNDLKDQFINEKRKRTRSSNKERSSLMYYKSKRVRNDYSTNPLKQDVAVLTWVSASEKNQKRNSDYHLATDTLTHKMIQSLGSVYDDLLQQRKEIKNFQRMQPVQEDHYQRHSKNMEDIKSQLNDSENKLTSGELEVGTYLQSSSGKHLEIDTIENEIKELMQKMQEKGDNHKALKVAVEKVSDLKDAVERQRHLSESKLSESSYMQKEIERASLAETDCHKEQTKVQDEIANLRKLIDSKIQEQSDSSKKEVNRTEILKSQLAQESGNLKSLYSKLGYINAQLSKIQPSRGRQATVGRSKK